MKSKELSDRELEELKKVQRKKNQKNLQSLLIKQADAKRVDKYSDKQLDRENEKKRLLIARNKLSEIEGIDKILLKKPADYVPIFTQDFYREIFRLNKWKIKGKNISIKPPITASYTNQLIYYRFTDEILSALQLINPYVNRFIRQYKYHQFLTDYARAELKKFIAQATETMKNHTDWYEFIVDYCTKYNIPYQKQLFREA